MWPFRKRNFSFRERTRLQIQFLLDRVNQLADAAARRNAEHARELGNCVYDINALRKENHTLKSSVNSIVLRLDRHFEGLTQLEEEVYRLKYTKAPKVPKRKVTKR